MAIIGLWGWYVLFYIFGGLGFLNLPLLYFLIKISLERDISISKIDQPTSDETSVGLMCTEKSEYLFIALAYSGFMCAFFGLLSWLPRNGR